METRIDQGQNRLRATTAQTGAPAAPKTATGRPSFSKILRKDDPSAGGSGSPDPGQVYGRQTNRDPLSHPQRAASPPRQAPVPAPANRTDRMAGFITQHSLVSSPPASQPHHGAATLKNQDLVPLGRATAAPSQPPATGATGETTHQVKAGDSLWKIARNHNMDWRDLARHNQIENPSLIRIGQEIRIPGAAAAANPAAAPAASAPRPAAATTTAASSPAASAGRPAPVPIADASRSRVESKFSAGPTAGSVPFSMAPRAPAAAPRPAAAAPRPAPAAPQPAAAAAPRPAPARAAQPIAGPFVASPSAAPEMGRASAAFAPRAAAAPPAAAPPAFAPRAAAPAAARVQAPAASRPAAAAAPVAAPASVGAVSGAGPASGVGRASGTAPAEDPMKAMGLDETTVDQIIDRTSKYEGSYTSLNRNTDKAGLSFGFIQFAQKPGSLGQVMTAMAKKNPVKFQKVFGPDAQKMLQMVTKAPDHGVDASGKALNPKFDLTKEPWAGRFETAGKDPEFQGVQRQIARKHYFTPMLEVAKEHNIKSPEGLSMLFDTSVQQGRNGMQRILRHAAKKRTPGMSEREFLEVVAHTAAKAAGPRWQKNVLNRRMGILNDPEIAKFGKPSATAAG